MGKFEPIPVSFRRKVFLIVALTLVLSSTTVAHAQSSRDAQYSSPTATASGNPAASGNTAASKTSASTETGKAPARGAASKATTGGGSTKVLPATGGISLSLITVGTLALGATGLLILQRTGRR